MKRILLLVVLAWGIWLPSVAQKSEQGEHLEQVTSQLEIFNDLYRQLDQYYVDTLNPKKQIENAILYMLAQLDPYTVYYAQDQKEDLKQMTTGKYAGIGSVISYDKRLDRNIIREPYEGMPAAEAGLRPGDIILRIGDKEIGVCGKQDVAEYSSSISNALRGEPATSFQLVVKRPWVADSMTFKLTRRVVELPSVTYYGILADSVGYLSLNGYTEHTSRDVRLAFEDLKRKGAKRLMLDLRGNGGGLMMEAVNLVNLFLPRGYTVVSTKGKVKEEESSFKTRKEPWDTEIPLVVLTDFGTASAAEITSGALQDYDRAVIVGERTYGKGLVQQPRLLENGAMFKLTTSKYYIPSGRCIQAYEFENGMPKHLPDSLTKEFQTAAGRLVRDGGGINPDVNVKADSLPNFIDMLTISDALFDYVVKYRNTHDQIAPADEFHLTAAEYADFQAFVKEKKFTYDRGSSRMLDMLRKMAKLEGYAEVAKDEFKALEAKLSPDINYDFKRWEKEVRKLVETAIVTSFYYEKGAILATLQEDKFIQEGLKVLCDDARYRSILAAPKKK